MASMVANPPSNGANQSLPGDKGSRNKRKFRADPPFGDPNKYVSLSDNDLPIYEFPSEKIEKTNPLIHQKDPREFNIDPLQLGLGLYTEIGSSTLCSPKEETKGDDLQDDADWSDLTESELEEILSKNLETILKSAVKKLVACGYSEEAVNKAVLRSGVYYGSKDILSNVFENALTILRNGQEEVDFPKEHCFEDLEQMKKYVLAELVCVLQEVRPSFTTGDAMWCLLICDMNVSNACASDGKTDTSSSNDVDLGVSNSNLSQTQIIKTETSSSEFSFSASGRSNPSKACPKTCECETVPVSGVPNFVKPKRSSVSPISCTESQIKTIYSKKNTGIHRKEYVLRQKSYHMDKAYRSYGSKGSSRAGKLSSFGSLMFDKKLRSLPESSGLNFKSATVKISKTTVIDKAQVKCTHEKSSKNEPETVKFVSDLPKTSSSQSLVPKVNDTPPALPETELSLSLPKSKPFDSSPLSEWVPLDKKDAMMVKLFPRVQELQTQLRVWNDWANEKVMQAARRLGKDKSELKMLRQEKDEVEKIKREKQILEENTVKKLSEMENALLKTSGQVERANGAVRRLEVDNKVLRREMESAKLRAFDSAANCEEALKREKMSGTNVQSWVKQKAFFQEELVAEKRKLVQLNQEMERAKDRKEQQEARWKQENKAKEELLNQLSSRREEREKLEASTRAQEDMIKSTAETNLKKYKDNIQKLENEISQLRMKNDSSKIAAMRRGIVEDPKEAHLLQLSRRMMAELEQDDDYSEVKRERECVMCLSEETSVVFLPCAHQVVCAKCNENHEKQGMKDCPSCRSPIQRRICVRFAHS